MGYFEISEDDALDPTQATSGNYTAPTNATLAEEALALVTGSKTGLIVAIIIVIVVIILVVLIVRKAVKGLAEAKERAMSKMKALLGREKADQSEAMPMVEAEPIQPASSSKKRLTNLGEIKFSLAYDDDTSELIIKVHECKELPLKYVGGTVYTYVEVEMIPYHRMSKEKPKTRYIRSIFSPEFNDEIRVRMTRDEVEDQNLFLHACAYNQLSTRDLIGSYKLDLEDVSLKKGAKEKKYGGELKWIDSIRGAELGDVLLSLRYSAGDERLEVTVKELKGIRPLPGKTTANTFVRLYLVRSTKQLADARTKTAKKNLEPRFNQTFVFNVSEDLIDEVNLIVRVKIVPLIGPNKLVGEVCVGCHSSGQALHHWQLMIQKGVQIDMWHQLEILNIVPGETNLKTDMGPRETWNLSEEPSSSSDDDDDDEGLFGLSIPGMPNLLSSESTEASGAPKPKKKVHL